MRVPTSAQSAFAWHTQAMEAIALRDEAPAIVEQEPQCGWFKRKYHASAVFVPARIWLIQYVDDDGELTRPEELACEVAGDRYDPFDIWIELCANPITQNEFEHLMRVREWARSRPDQPEAKPLKPVDFMTVQPPTWGKRKRR